MLESTESLLPVGRNLKVIAVGFSENPLDELVRLLDTLKLEVVGRVIVSGKKIDPATYITLGKLEEIKALAVKTHADVVIVDVELSPNQIKNTEKFLDRPTIDRPGVIIEIFSQHARTKEAKTQVELARMEYILPRLAHLWSHFERQRGGGAGNKGMGEKQIEVDRRLVKKRIQILQKKLEDIKKERALQRSGRKDVLKVALVGYTNAGKSTLLNALTDSEVLVEDRLFATLDSSVRMLSPHSHPPVVAVDTVGFVSRLPPSLVASFRSTLEELHEADFLVHVVDGSSPTAKEEFKITEEVIQELGILEKPRMTVINKSDQMGGESQPIHVKNFAKLISPGAMVISARNPEEVKKLRESILSHFLKNLSVYDVLIPYHESKLESLVHQFGTIEMKKHLERGTFFRVRMTESMAEKIKLLQFRLG